MALVTASYVRQLTGADVSDAERVAFLMDVASGLVQEYAGRTWTVETAPTSVKAAVAYLVHDALMVGDETPWTRAEQIGDYRVEYQDGESLGMSLSRVAHLLDLPGARRVRVGSIITPIPFDGEEESV